MLPYTAYIIPEAIIHKTEAAHKWLFFFHNEPLTPAKTELLHKIATALKADFEKDLFCKFLAPGKSAHYTHGHAEAPQLILSFGIEPSDIGYWIDLQTTGIRFLESCVFIRTSTLSALENNPHLKKSLWNDMQTFLEWRQS